MQGDFACFVFIGEMKIGDAVWFKYSLNCANPLIAQAWDILTGRKENPLGHRPLFDENEWHDRIAEAQRIIHAHMTFGGEDLIFLFNKAFHLHQIHIESSKTILWKSSPQMVRLSSTDRTQRYSCN